MEPCLGPVSRRTRSGWDSYYKKAYDKSKKKLDNTTACTNHCEELGLESSGVGKRQREDGNCIIIDDSEDSSIAEDDESSSSTDDDSDKNYKLHSKNSAKEKGNHKAGRVLKKKRMCAMGDADMIDVLVDSILKEKELRDSMSIWKECDLFDQKTKEKLVLLRANGTSQSELPLKFQFEDDQESCSTSIEKTVLEKEIDSLFDDLDFVWESVDDCPNSSLIDDECTTTSEDIDKNPAARCCRGDHEVVLDEEIGIICKHCVKVLMDIKYVMPPICADSSESSEKKSREGSDDDIMNQIQFQSMAKGNLRSSARSKGTVLDLIPKAKKELYLHQLEGIEFLWKNIAGSIHLNELKKLPPISGSGCIISHAPGTGKTRLTIVFIQTFLKLYPKACPVIVAPKGILLTWEQQLKTWNADIRFHNLYEKELSSEEMAFASSTWGMERINKNSKDHVRLVKLLFWTKGGSILGVGYRLFEELAGNHQKKRRNKCHNQKIRLEAKKILLKAPDLLVLDEGHTPRNHQTLMWKALTNVTTKRRIILSGTPFQNNLNELMNTLSLVNPKFSHQITSTGAFRKLQGMKTWTHLTNDISNDDGFKTLRAMIEPFVHIHNGSILQKALPGLKDRLIILKPTRLQSELLQNVDHHIGKFIEQVHVSSLILVHPSLVSKKPEFARYNEKLESVKWKAAAGVKTQFVAKLVELAIRKSEKVLVFSEYIDPLRHIQGILKQQFDWQTGREVMYMDGDLSIKERQRLMNTFNEKRSKGRVMLASQRACSEGISLVGASRVVLLDVAWNPSVERQAICRAYRLGQEKVVHVYRLVTRDEVNKYAKQAVKEKWSKLIFHGGDDVEADMSGGGDDEDDDVVGYMRGLGMFEKDVVAGPKGSDLLHTFGFV